MKNENMGIAKRQAITGRAEALQGEKKSNKKNLERNG
jgi:hypothetical protein